MRHSNRHDSLSLETMLAASAEPAGDDGAGFVLLFESGPALYAVAASDVASIAPAGWIAPLPYPPPGVAGATSIGGRMCLVLRLTDPAESASGPGRLVELSGDRNLALWADTVVGVVPAPCDDPDGSDGDAGMLRIGDRRVKLLDPGTLVGS